MNVGVDEAGTGSAISDAYACAVILDPQLMENKLITDSKKLTPKKRDQAYEIIINSQTQYGVGTVTNKEIDEMGMGKARRLIFVRALEDLRKKVGQEVIFDNVILDGTLSIDYSHAKQIECIPKADFIHAEVSAASIIAKVLRDRKILDLCSIESELAERYKWTSNKGYLTKDHLEAIGTYGLSEFHRKSFTYKTLT